MSLAELREGPLTATVPPLMADPLRGPDLSLEHGRLVLAPTVAPKGSEASADVALPDRWAEVYVLDEEMPGGGMSRLWLAHRTDCGESCVVRRVPAKGIDGYVTVELLRELGTGAPDQRRLVRQYETVLGAADNAVWQVVEYCPGGTAADIPVEERYASVGVAGGLLEQFVSDLAEALETLHHRGLAHTDIKPDNILVRPDGTFALADLDTCILVGAPNKPSPHGSGHRSPGYTAPDAEYSIESDYFQLGLTLLHLATGVRRPSEEYFKIDYGALAPRVELLLSGLLEPDRTLRWGRAQLAQWLEGIDPLVATRLGTRVARESRQFSIQYASAFFHDPTSLGQRIARDWSTARRVLRGVSNDRPWLLELADQLARTGASDAAASLSRLHGDLDTPASDSALDTVIANLIRMLDPDGVPRYSVDGGASVVLSTAGLLEFAHAVIAEVLDDRPSSAGGLVVGLLRAEILHPLSQMTGAHPGLWDIPDHCDRALTEYRRLVLGALRSKQAAVDEVTTRLRGTDGLLVDTYADMIATRPLEDWECYAAMQSGQALSREDDARARRHEATLRALLFAYSVNPTTVSRLQRQVGADLASSATSQLWFAVLAGADRDGRSTGRSQE